MPHADNRLKTLERYKREERLSRALVLQLRDAGITALYVGMRLDETLARINPIDLLIERKLVALVRVNGVLTTMDRAWLIRHPDTLTLGAPGDLERAMPAIVGRLKTTTRQHELARALIAARNAYNRARYG